MSYETRHKPESSRFEICEEGRIAYAEYYIHDGYIDIMHTIVPVSLENRGIASALVRAVYDWGRDGGLNPKGTCSFASAWLKRHPEYLE